MITAFFALFLVAAVTGIAMDDKSQDVKFMSKCYEVTKDEKCFDELKVRNK